MQCCQSSHRHLVLVFVLKPYLCRIVAEKQSFFVSVADKCELSQFSSFHPKTKHTTYSMTDKLLAPQQPKGLCPSGVKHHDENSDNTQCTHRK